MSSWTMDSYAMEFWNRDVDLITATTMAWVREGYAEKNQLHHKTKYYHNQSWVSQPSRSVQALNLKLFFIHGLWLIRGGQSADIVARNIGKQPTITKYTCNLEMRFRNMRFLYFDLLTKKKHWQIPFPYAPKTFQSQCSYQLTFHTFNHFLEEKIHLV